MNETELIKRIELHIRESSFMRALWGYRNWHIGLSCDEESRISLFNSQLKWKLWKAESPESAHAVKKYFIKEGMKSCGEEKPDSQYIYVY